MKYYCDSDGLIWRGKTATRGPGKAILLYNEEAPGRIAVINMDDAPCYHPNNKGLVAECHRVKLFGER